EVLVGIKKPVFLRHGVLIPAANLLALRAQGEGQGELRSDAIAVGSHVTNDTDRLCLANRGQNTVNDLGMGFHLGSVPAISALRAVVLQARVWCVPVRRESASPCCHARANRPSQT